MKKEYLPYVFLTLGVLLYIFLTINYKLGVTTDSVRYMEVSSSILKDQRIAFIDGTFSTHFPPAYPLLISTVSWALHIGVFEAGYVLNVIMLFLIGLIFISVLQFFDFNNLIIQLFPVVFILSLPLAVSRMYWTDLTFHTTQLFIVFNLMKWIREDHFKYIILAGVFSGVMFLTRYAAIGIIGGFILFIFFKSKSIKKFIKVILLYMTPIFLAYLMWSFYAGMHDTAAIDRKIGFHPVEWYKLKMSIMVFGSWFIGKNYDALPITIPLAFIFFVSFFAILFKHRSGIQELIQSKKLYLILFLAIPASYYPFLLASISFFDAYGPLDHRMLSPLFPSLMLCLTFGINYIIQHHEKKALSYGLITLFCLITIHSSFDTWKTYFLEGKGYSGKSYSKYNQDKIKKIVSSGKETYSNGRDIISFFFNKGTYDFPSKYHMLSMTKNEAYDDKVDEIKSLIRKNKAQFIFFEEVTWRGFMIEKEEALDYFKEFTVTQLDGAFLISN